ncbi:MAG: serine/threonine-protein phosphatase [Spirochaetes bacterium]|nr:serine/threonine-protein phosphatase [Spirochaetota bacterium]
MTEHDTEKLRQFELLHAEANSIRERDKVLIRGLFQNFYNKKLNVGIGFQRAYGAILSGDYFDLIQLPDGNYLFIFADMSGHGLPAYTNLVRLRSAITISVGQVRELFYNCGSVDCDLLVRTICSSFTDIMEGSNSHDFACVLFTFIYNEGDKFHLKFYNRGMLFPVIVRKFQERVVDVYNLNNEEKGWIPMKGNLLSGDVRSLLEDRYLDIPSCQFTLYEGDSILYYSDGIIEAYRPGNPMEEYGEARMIKILLENISLVPQLVVHELFASVYGFMGAPEKQKDDMTAVLIDFPPVRY